MILGNGTAPETTPPSGRRHPTIDDLFRRAAALRPDALALADAPNRMSFTDGAPRRLTYEAADRAVAAIAARLRRMELSTDAIIGIQLPNTVENFLTILGVLRAGMIAAPLPLLWRRTDAVAALTRIGAKALITCGHLGSFNHCQSALRIASEVFSIRYVCGYGDNLPDGVVAFDDLLAAKKPEALPPLEREQQTDAATHVALMTFEVGERGIVPVARNHLEALAGGLGIVLESRLAQEARLLSTIAPSSFGGISLSLLPWLVSGGTLILHHPYDPNVLARQIQDENCGTLVVPGPVALRLGDVGTLANGNGLNCVVAAWRAPDRLAASPLWRERDTFLVDVTILGEAGLFAVRRGAAGKVGPVPLGPVVAPRGSAGAVAVAELAQTEAGTLGVRGRMVPKHAFPPGIERSGLPHFRIGPSGLVDTGYPCRIDSATRAIVVTGQPAGMVSVGGYRFPLDGLREAISRLDGAAKLAALPDPFIGQRLIGNATDRAAMRAALEAVGVNPIVAAAFRERSMGAAAQAET